MGGNTRIQFRSLRQSLSEMDYINASFLTHTKNEGDGAKMRRKRTAKNVIRYPTWNKMLNFNLKHEFIIYIIPTNDFLVLQTVGLLNVRNEHRSVLFEPFILHSSLGGGKKVQWRHHSTSTMSAIINDERINGWENDLQRNETDAPKRHYEFDPGGGR